MPHPAVTTRPLDTRSPTKPPGSTRLGRRSGHAGYWAILATISTAIATGLAIRGWA